MKTLNVVLILMSLLVAPGAALAQSGVTGSWVTTDFATPIIIALKANGAALTGSITQAAGLVDIYDGKVEGATITFKASIANGGRINTYTGKLTGNQIAFTRTVQVRDAAANFGVGIFGAGGPMQFKAKRDTPAPPVYTLLCGRWVMNLQKSKYTPGPPPKLRVPTVAQFVAQPGGALGYIYVEVSEQGTPRFAQTVFKPDASSSTWYNSSVIVNVLSRTSTAPELPTQSARIIDGRTFEYTIKNSTGAVTEIDTVAVSLDGKTINETDKVMNLKGQVATTAVWVFEKQ
jgi:hypothetical protein